MLASRSKRIRGSLPCERFSHAYGLDVAAILAGSAGSAATAGTATAAGAGTATAAGASAAAAGAAAGTGLGVTFGSAAPALAGGLASIPATAGVTAGLAPSLFSGIAAGAAPGLAAIPAAVGPAATMGPAAVQSALNVGSVLSQITSGLGTAVKVGMPLASAGQSLKGAQDSKKASKSASQQARRRASAETAMAQDKARAVMALNDVATAAGGVVGGSGSAKALAGSSLRNLGADIADINAGAAFGINRIRARSGAVQARAYGNAANSFFDAGTRLTDIF